MKIQNLKKGDFIIAIFAVIAILLFFLFRGYSSSQKKAIVKIDGKIYMQIDLNSDYTDTEIIEFENGSYMELTYDSSGIAVTDVTCPDKICQNTGKINRTNQQIVCLPNKTIIYIEGKNIDSEVDKIN